MFRHLLKLIFGHHRHHCGVAFLAVGLTLIAGMAFACPVSVGQVAVVAAPSYAVAAPSIAVSCGQQVAAVAQPQAVYAAPVAVQAVPALMLPSYSFATPFVGSSVYGASFVGSPLFVDRFGVAHQRRFFDGRIRERQAVRANARANRALSRR